MSTIEETGGRISRLQRPASGLHSLEVNCFTPGTLIATPRGDVAVDRIAVGDRVVTRDNGVQDVRWTGRKALSGPALAFDTRLHPVRIRAGALGPELPARDLWVSPNHRLLLVGQHPALDAGESEVFVTAKHLVGTRGVDQVEVAEVSYLHFMCDHHEVVLSDGTWTESFHPSDGALRAAGDAARDELFELFPDLRDEATRRNRRAARRTLGVAEVKSLRL